MRSGRLGADRPARFGLADLRPVRQYRIDHRCGYRRHLPLRRPRLDPGHDLRRPHCRSIPAWLAHDRHRPAMDLFADRLIDHRRRRYRSVDQKGVRLMEPLLTARGLVKRYGRVTALDNADFDLYPGEILAVIGDNGAGKSSMIRVLSGAMVPDTGEIRLDGNVVAFRTPLDAQAAGIETVYQT